MKNSYSFLRRTSAIATILIVGLFALLSCEKVLGDKEKEGELNKPEVVEQVIGCWHTKYSNYDFHVTLYEDMKARFVQYLHTLNPDQDDFILMDGILEWETRGDKRLYLFETGDTESYWSMGEIRDGKTLGLTLNDPNGFVTFYRDANCSKGPTTHIPPTPPDGGTVNHPDTVMQITGTWRIEASSYLREIIFKDDMTAEEIKYTSNDHGPAIHYTWKTIDNFLLLFDEKGSEVEVGQMTAPNLIRLNPNEEYNAYREMLKAYEWIPNGNAYSLEGTWKSYSEDNSYRLIELECDRENNPTVARLTEADGTVREGHWYEYGLEVRIWFDEEWNRETDLRFIHHQGNHYNVTLRIFPGFGSSEEYYPQRN